MSLGKRCHPSSAGARPCPWDCCRPGTGAGLGNGVWGGPSNHPVEIQAWGCLNLVLEHRTVAAQRCFQAKNSTAAFEQEV